MTSDSPLLKRSCPVCGHEEYTDWVRPAQSPGPVVRCRRCTFVYVNPIETCATLIQEGPVLGGRSIELLESSDLGQIEGSWEEPIIQSHLRELTTKEANARDVLERINRLSPRCGVLLDVGCFCGVFLSVASQVGWDCYGVEPLVMPAVYARGHFGLSVVTDTLRSDTYPSQFFDVITSFQVFEHLIHPDQEMAKVRRILRPGGLLVTEVPCVDTLLVRLLRSKHRHYVSDHVSFFSLRTLSILLERKGFRVREAYYPARTMTVRKLLWWLGRYAGSLDRVVLPLPQRLLESSLRVNIRDIVTVIAERED